MGTLRAVWEMLTFSDVNPLLKALKGRPAQTEDASSLPGLLQTEKAASRYLEFKSALPMLRKSVLKSVISFEAPQYKIMFWIHIVDVHVAIFSALLSVQILKIFNGEGEGSALLKYFVSEPTALNKGLLAAALASVVLFLNLLAASLHAQKIEREMLVNNRLRFQLASYIQNLVFAVSREGRNRYKAGDIINMAQSDASRIAAFFAHAFVDFPVLFVSVSVIMALMYSYIGHAAWIGLGILMLQIPISAFFSWLSNKINFKLMEKSDARMSIATEWISAPRIIRYFGWSPHFEKSLAHAATKEFQQEVRLKAQWSLAFSLSTTWSFFVCVGIFAGFLLFQVGFEPPQVFASIWLAAILGHQLNPLPWFVNTFAESRVGAQRMEQLFRSKLQEEEFDHIEGGSLPNSTEDFLIGYELENVTVQHSDAAQPLLTNISLKVIPGQLTALVGPVGSGKSTFLQLLLGEIVPHSGKVWIVVHSHKDTNPQNSVRRGRRGGANDVYMRRTQVSDDESNKARPNFQDWYETQKFLLHSLEGVQWIRQFQTFVPQEAFVANATLGENVPLEFLDSKTFTQTQERAIIQSLALAELDPHSSAFPQGLATEIGERGVNLSGGQKQRLSMARAVHAQARVAFLDDPLSAVDENMEDKLVRDLFEGQFLKRNMTLLWATHRLRHISKAAQVLEFDGQGGIVVTKGLSADRSPSEDPQQGDDGGDL